MEETKDTLKKDDGPIETDKASISGGSPESGLERNNETCEVLLAMTIGLQALRFDLSKENGVPKIKLHFHPRDTSEVCTQICKEIIHCTLNNKCEEKRKDVKQLNFECGQCGTKKTPLWRRHGDQMVCNACGLYIRTHGGMSRPKKLFKNNRKDKNEEGPEEPIAKQDSNK
ncbi:hypothetical protein NEAUS07_0652 [Nematocida ausubeli]|nr:hypothetical protein NEAUS07_0652 [Nematocida ausubeli]KAI5134697.1 hypothetical protein NEAUS06_1256 [Nematocida ausubeli]